MGKIAAVSLIGEHIIALINDCVGCNDVNSIVRLILQFKIDELLNTLCFKVRGFSYIIYI